MKPVGKPLLPSLWSALHLMPTPKSTTTTWNSLWLAWSNPDSVPLQPASGLKLVATQHQNKIRVLLARKKRLQGGELPLSAVIIHAHLHNWNGKVKQTAEPDSESTGPLLITSESAVWANKPSHLSKSEETILPGTAGSYFWGLNAKGDTPSDLIPSFSGSCVTQLTGESIQRDHSLGCPPPHSWAGSVLARIMFALLTF